MPETIKCAPRGLLARVALGALVMVLSGLTVTHARGIRVDDPANGGGDSWVATSGEPSPSAFQPGGTSGGPVGIYEDTVPSELYGFLPDPPLFDGFTTGYMYNWGSPIDAQVVLYTGTDDGTQQVCDDAGDPCSTPASGSDVTEIDFNYNSCVLGGALTWDGATYKNTSAASTCDNAFIFVDGVLYGSAPPGWTSATSTSVPEPGTFALLAFAGLPILLLTLHHKAKRRVI